MKSEICLCFSLSGSLTLFFPAAQWGIGSIARQSHNCLLHLNLYFFWSSVYQYLLKTFLITINLIVSVSTNTSHGSSTESLYLLWWVYGNWFFLLVLVLCTGQIHELVEALINFLSFFLHFSFCVQVHWMILPLLLVWLLKVVMYYYNHEFLQLNAYC